MSTNEKQETCYFSHDANAKDDFKVMLLIEELGLEGYGIFWVLIETLREQQNYKYPLRLLSVLARKYNTTLTKLEVVVRNYHLFVIEDDCFFYSSSLNRRMQKMEEVREQRVLSAKIGAQKRKQKQLEQLKQLQINLSNNDSSEQMLSECSTNAKQIKEKKNKEKEIKSSIFSSDENEAEKFEQLNEHLLSKQLSKDLSIQKLENLEFQKKENEILI
ncbi:DUF4373 domain-containing protein [Aliarcobacter butzleri]|uniref:DUF4373 domain-containing protein n=1 Tax=Aliarcobacter butzleri TaxID=28197 RepID=A0AAW6VIR1_9BACT|nr:DUF4373 domain-containing protein [Aliarcobacter butzleri]MDK2042064.1 DUF4373 domain-containing protein [Aliarcobacter butzleri]MDK2097283.1 DUF4373 domain-containing protein [Aliarcobacter butzleri]